MRKRSKSWICNSICFLHILIFYKITNLLKLIPLYQRYFTFKNVLLNNELYTSVLINKINKRTLNKDL